MTMSRLHFHTDYAYGISNIFFFVARCNNRMGRKTEIQQQHQQQHELQCKVYMLLLWCKICISIESERNREREIPRYKYTNTNKWNRTKHSTLWSNAGTGTSTRNAPMLKHNANIILIYCAYNNEAHKLVTLWCSFDCFSSIPFPRSLSLQFSMWFGSVKFSRVRACAHISTDVHADPPQNFHVPIENYNLKSKIYTF